jgi:hypothetical protein
MTTIASLDRIGGRRQQRVIKKRQGFFKMRREDLLEGLANPREPLDPLPQLFQLAQGGLRAATPVKQRLWLDPINKIGKKRFYRVFIKPILRLFSIGIIRPSHRCVR